MRRATVGSHVLLGANAKGPKRVASFGSWRFELAKRKARLLARYRWAQNAWLKRQNDLRSGSTQVKLKV